jgi:hypothetical protein
MRPFLLTIAFVVLYSSNAASQVPIDADKLKSQIAEYGSCQGGCAAELAKDLVAAAPDAAVKTVAYLKSAKKLDPKLGVLAFAAFAQNMYANGKKIVNDDIACYQKCDDLNAAIVQLGSSGALGAMKRGDRIDPEVLKNQKVLDAYMKFIKPIPLPAEERSKEWGKFISSLS